MRLILLEHTIGEAYHAPVGFAVDFETWDGTVAEAEAVAELDVLHGVAQLGIEEEVKRVVALLEEGEDVEGGFEAEGCLGGVFYASYGASFRHAIIPYFRAITGCVKAEVAAEAPAAAEAVGDGDVEVVVGMMAQDARRVCVGTVDVVAELQAYLATLPEGCCVLCVADKGCEDKEKKDILLHDN